MYIIKLLFVFIRCLGSSLQHDVSPLVLSQASPIPTPFQTTHEAASFYFSFPLTTRFFSLNHHLLQFRCTYLQYIKNKILGLLF